MNSLLLISPYRAWGFKPILSGKGDNAIVSQLGKN
jgi:hypothetical protein